MALYTQKSANGYCPDRERYNKRAFALAFTTKVFADCLDEDNVTVALDISGRPHVKFDFCADFTRDKVGQMSAQMVPHFFHALAVAMGLSLHMYVSEGNAHHQIEALFKAFGRALRVALARSGNELPSSKGKL